MRNQINLFMTVVLLIGLSACSTLTTTKNISVSSSESWVLLPINNLSTTPRAGDKTNAMLETHLRIRGVTALTNYVSPEGLSLVSMLDTQKELADAITWGHSNGMRYGITGTIHEWHYKSGPDKEPAVGMSLKIIDLTNERVLWQGTTAKTGWGYTNLSGVADKVVEKLLDQVSIERSY